MFKKIILSTTILSLSLFAQSDRFTEEVRVDYSKPVYETIEKVIPHKYHQSCFEEYELRKPRHHTRREVEDENNIGLDTIIGATAGVIIGNQIGKGNGRTAAKIIGGIVGAGVANSMRNYEKIDSYSYENDYYYETKRKNTCQKREPRVIKKNILKGYENYFTYRGNTYTKFSQDRLSYVRVRTKINF